MSKQTKIEEIKEIMKSQRKLKYEMKIFIQAKPKDERRFYKSVPWDKENIEVTCTNKAGADSLIQYLSDLHIAASNNPIITGMRIIKDE